MLRVILSALPDLIQIQMSLLGFALSGNTGLWQQEPPFIQVKKTGSRGILRAIYYLHLHSDYLHTVHALHIPTSKTEKPECFIFSISIFFKSLYVKLYTRPRQSCETNEGVPLDKAAIQSMHLQKKKRTQQKYRKNEKS